MICRDLIITPDVVETFIDELTKKLSTAWARRFDKEKHLKGLVFDSFVFERCRQTGEGELLLLTPKGHCFEVSNIGSPDGDLEAPEYNAIIGEFAELVRSVFADRAAVTLGPDRVPPLPERLGPVPMLRLQEYAGMANVHTGGAHPLDRKRWNRFVIACHQADVGEPEDIREYLTERGWDKRHVEAHVDRFEFGRGLLASYDAC